MAFDVKPWRDAPDASTPISAAALRDLEARLAAYADALAALKQDAATAATDAELSALTASVAAALALKQDAATAATDAELAAHAADSTGVHGIADTADLVVTSDPRLNASLFVRKAADEQVTNSAALQDDDHLSVAVEAGGVYVVDGFLVYTSDASADIKLGWVAPAGASFTWSPRGVHIATANGAGFAVTDIATFAATGGNGVGSKVSAHIMGLLVVAATAGPFKLQWAQNTAAAGLTTTLYANSFLRLTKVA